MEAVAAPGIFKGSAKVVGEAVAASILLQAFWHGHPSELTDFPPISISIVPVWSRTVEQRMVHMFIYLALQEPTMKELTQEQRPIHPTTATPSSFRKRCLISSPSILMSPS